MGTGVREMVRAPAVPAPIVRGFEPSILTLSVSGTRLTATYTGSNNAELVNVIANYTATSTVTLYPTLEVQRESAVIYRTVVSHSASGGTNYTMNWIKGGFGGGPTSGLGVTYMGDGILLKSNDLILVYSITNEAYFSPRWGRAILKVYYP